MKKLVFLFGFMAVLASCSSDDVSNVQEEINVEVKQSSALRVSLENIKRSTGNTNRMATESDELCFQFEYPIVLEYNTGSQITVADYPQLLNVLLNESVAAHITGIGFPFNVIQYADNSTLTISDEDEFQSLIVGCGYNPVTVSQVVTLTDDCFEVVYPITVLVNENPQTFNNQTEAEDYFWNNIQNITSIAVQYPFSVVMVDTTSEVAINNDYELINLINTTCGIN